MNKEQYLEYFKATCERMYNTTRKKNSDYTGDTQDPFFNFSVVEYLGVLPTEKGIFTRISDKFVRISSFLKKGTLLVEEESVEDTLIDMASYCILFSAYLKQKRENK